MRAATLPQSLLDSQTTNRYGEDWSCSVSFPGNPTHHNCVGFVLQHGHMRPLLTLGGDNGYAAGANQQGWERPRTLCGAGSQR